MWRKIKKGETPHFSPSLHVRPRLWCRTSHPFFCERRSLLRAPREGPRWPHYTSRYLKCLHMWTVMLFAAAELLSRPPKALGDLLFLLSSPSSSPSPSRAPSLSPTCFSRDILSETARRPRWLSHVPAEEGGSRGKRHLEESETGCTRLWLFSLCFLPVNTLQRLQCIELQKFLKEDNKLQASGFSLKTLYLF